MRWLSLFALILGTVPALAQEGEAEKLYRAMETKIRNADSLVVEFSRETDPKREYLTKGTLSISTGNKLRLEGELNIDGLASKILMVCDGRSTYVKAAAEKPRVDKSPTPRREVVLFAVARFSPTIVGRIGDSLDFDEELAVTKFKVGAKEKIGDHEAQVIHYQLKDGSTDFAVSDWIDVKTQLPLKRVMVRVVKGKEFRSTETYSAFTLDSKLDRKLFEISK